MDLLDVNHELYDEFIKINKKICFNIATSLKLQNKLCESLCDCFNKKYVSTYCNYFEIIEHEANCKLHLSSQKNVNIKLYDLIIKHKIPVSFYKWTIIKNCPIYFYEYSHFIYLSNVNSCKPPNDWEPYEEKNDNICFL